MKIILFITVMLMIGSIGISQSTKTKTMLNEIEGKWEVDDHDNITYIVVVELDSLSIDEIYLRAKNYFIYNYGSGKSVIQTEDKKLGRIVGKGVFKSVYATGDIVFMYNFDTWHIFRIDIKEGRARLMLTLTSYDELVYDSQSTNDYNIKISETFPVNPKGKKKNMFGKAFYYSHKQALLSLESLKSALISGNIDSEIENDDW